MLDKFKELLYKISHSKVFLWIYIALLCVVGIIHLLLYIHPYIFIILLELFLIIRSFKRFDIDTIKKNKVITIVLSNHNWMIIPPYFTFSYFSSLINNTVLFILFVILYISIFMLLIIKITMHFEKKIIK